MTGTKLSGPQNFTPNDFVYTHVCNLTSEGKVHFRCFFLFPATILVYHILVHQCMVGYIITRVITIFDLALGLSP